MFREWLHVFKEDAVMTKILAEYEAMIEDARWMFHAIGQSLVGGEPPESFSEELLERDQRLNQAEKRIRKRIIEHLALNPAKDLGLCLVLFSGVKDAERLGDYCKNLQELSGHLRGYDLLPAYRPAIAAIFSQIEQLFSATAKAFAESSREKAREVMDALVPLKKECHRIVEEILENGNELDTRAAVATALTTRYFKRLAAHLSNIASGVINPVHKIDYYLPNQKHE